jgi:hypothetical protein
MKHLSAFLVFISFMLLSGGAIAQGPEQRANRTPSITVMGTGTAYGTPDIASIRIGVVTEAASAAEALKENNEAMNRLHNVITKRGIDKKDFQTVQFTVSPRYTYDKSRQSPPAVTGYQVVNEVRVRNRNLSSLGEFLDEAVALGANQIRGISFDISDPSQLLDEARRKAFADAEHRARIYAGAAGLKLGTPITIEEQTGHAIPHTAMRMEAATAAAVPIAQGEQTLTVVVTVTFAVVDAR